EQPTRTTWPSGVSSTSDSSGVSGNAPSGSRLATSRMPGAISTVLVTRRNGTGQALLDARSLRPVQYDVCGCFRRHVRGALVAQCRQVDAMEEVLAGSEQPRRDGDVQLVDLTGLEVLPDGGLTADDLHVLPVRSVDRALHRLVDAAGDEMEHGTSLHLGRPALVVRQNEDGSVIRRIRPPPPAPGIVGPRTPDRTEHGAADDPCAYTDTEARGEVVVDTRRAARLALHALKGARSHVPVVQRFTPDAQGILAGLTRACSIAIERDREVVNSHPRHAAFLLAQDTSMVIATMPTSDIRIGFRSRPRRPGLTRDDDRPA